MVTWRTYKEAFRELTKATNAVLFRIVEDSADEFSEAFPAPGPKRCPNWKVSVSSIVCGFKGRHYAPAPGGIAARASP